ncbi:Myb-like DNA-binding domain containing protein [Tritrichomonas foetus]|uniref:Myb-like DNA-binding domain containing protein n=1 Tax=Tritrichomonas foetus TaxID=1144522 RepID=A0A1J4KR07_9EUKA|nr:Myb-like DNA-binding domain containing protein [Tritrichomonas foetus]|eukprot:OHT12236.1 Myb-like DNA-binding domain containing protein [Tritrichomonas foetus]
MQNFIQYIPQPMIMEQQTKRSLVCRKPFSIEEDARLIEIVKNLEPFSGWEIVAAHMKGRSARQCRERWIGYLSPGIRVEPWNDEEDTLLLQQISKLGHKWTIIALHFNGRSGNDVKNRWYSHLKDITYQSPDGNYQISRDMDGSIVNSKKKRKRKLISAYNVAVHKLEKKNEPKVHLVSFPTNDTSLFNSDLYLPPLLPNPLHAVINISNVI